MAWTVHDITKTITVTDPESGDTAEVTIRRMSEGDKRQMMETAQASDGTLGGIRRAMRDMRLKLAVTSWTLPIPTEQVLDLDPRVVDEIDEQIQLFNPGVFPTAMGAAERARHAENLATAVAKHLDGNATDAELKTALDAYTGASKERPTSTT
jgi:hypothetical protein